MEVGAIRSEKNKHLLMCLLCVNTKCLNALLKQMNIGETNDSLICVLSKDKNNISKKIIYLFFSVFFLIGIFTFKDYGLRGDEIFERQTGFYWLNYILSFTPFNDLKSIVAIKVEQNIFYQQIKGLTLPRTEDVPFYGVIFSLPAAFLEIIFKIDDSKKYYYLYHFLNFGLFFIASIFFYKLLLNRFSNINIALVGTLFYVLSPRIYASSFFNNKDLVFL